MSGRLPKVPTRRLQLQLAGELFEDWIRVEVTRSLEEISGAFELEIHDAARAARLAEILRPADGRDPIESGQACAVLIDGERVLDGWIDDFKPVRTGDSVRVTLSGRDKVGDLVDCQALPNGPAELRGLTLTEIARRVCEPFGITVRADTDVGAPIPVFSLDAAETALSALEKAARQRAVLLVSDGVGGLLLTRGGASRGASPIKMPGLPFEATGVFSWRERFRDYIVKGQTRAANGERGDNRASPLTAAAPPAPPANRAPAVRQRSGVVMTGRARDEAVGRYRPRVELSKSQSGGASVQTQAEWRMRVARAKSETLAYRLPDWRAGDEGKLWRPNELVAVDDAYVGINGDMLINLVAISYSEEGHTTRVELVGPEAYDLEPVAPRQRGRRRQAAAGDGTARPLTAEAARGS